MPLLAFSILGMMHWLPTSTMEDIVLFHNILWDPQRSLFPAFPYPSIFMLVVSLLLFSCSVVSDSLWPHGFPVPHHFPEFAQVHVHWISDAIRPSHPLSSSSPSAFSLSQHQGLFQWVSCSHQVAKVLELHLQHQSFQRVFRVDFL